MNPLLELKRAGQSIWYDNLRRAIVTSGELKRMIDEYGVTGVTSNPSIFEKAVSGGKEYDAAIAALTARGQNDSDLLDSIIASDIRLAADTFAPVFRSTNGADGFVSVEVAPALARNTVATVAEANRLRDLVDRPNVMIKVPGTIQGLSAIEELVYEGFNINVTLLFSVNRYAMVALAYIKGLEQRLAQGRPIDGIRGVASFFVSRVDTLSDRLISERLKSTASNDEHARLSAMLGRVAADNAKLAWLRYKDIYESERFAPLKRAGAHPQRLLWASTGTKNPAYSDVKYVEELIEPDTVNTMPLATLMAFHEHGRVRRTLPNGIDGARGLIAELAALGIDYEAMTSTLEEEGIKSFSDAFAALTRCVSEKAADARRNGHVQAAAASTATAIAAPVAKPCAVAEFLLGNLGNTADKELKTLDKARFSERLWEKDAGLWTKKPAQKKQIRNSLGWLNLAASMDAHKADITAFAKEVKDAGFKHAVLLGMGGSSLAPLVMAGSIPGRKGYPELIVLDSTDPDSVTNVTKNVDLEKTLFIVSSKSGTTIEPLSFFEYFYDRLRAIKGEAAGENFVVITDPDTPLEGFHRKYRMRRLFTNQPDIGGRFSALSFFGLVPAAVAGIDISKLLYFGARVTVEMLPEVPLSENPGAVLGATLAALAKAGRDKLTFFIADELKAFGLWIEQLIAESTGKDGAGIVPISAEPAGKAADYGNDRVFVQITFKGKGGGDSRLLAALSKAGHPVIRFNITDCHELGGEFLRWEAATAAAGMLLNINPFDQPDVELAKVLARDRLGKAASAKGAKAPGVEFKSKGLTAYFGKTAMKKMARAGLKGKGLKTAIKAFCGLAAPGDYAGLLAYYSTFDPGVDKLLARLRKEIRDSTGCGVQAGYGPRYLHSTGQLHKGGANNGLFIILAHKAAKDIPVPGRPFGFSDLELAQVYGDAEALDSKGRRVCLLVMKDSKAGTLKEAVNLIKGAL
ncbi:MAG: bifunctional transaldolase/phosoglucose isomerase [Deltaproteobacteria bacterium]|nr:bifunctional transaldolase/phosoglucose isomerase [Deltaproteobacteria bacterium]